ncbi:hypothetical protein QNO07_09250 [Streptomyces sp. 549]|uniref:hypothetical protein n=1 Tax=Streptomyces sp. 549 TaxID=3049076 RepID=UPI0024C43510|nr:hypothetical protein [Streptomyces sp. 549]MDK1473604.1 hypothetical protein [Streptomyces sp. 549]
MPTAEDAARLAIEGGEPADQLHLTLRYLGKGADFDDTARSAIVDSVRMLAEGMPPITSKIFGAAHWNGNSDEPSWVWSVGDDPEHGRSLEAAQGMAEEALLMAPADVELPAPHTPWVAHVRAAYSDELDLIIALEERLGPITFDRVRVAFAGDHADIALGESATASARGQAPPLRIEVETNRGGKLALGAIRSALERSLHVPHQVTERVRTNPVTAAAADGPLRRKPTETETASRVDFTAIDDAWQTAVDTVTAAWPHIQAAQRHQITAAVTTAVAGDDIDQLNTLTVDTAPGTALLYSHMRRLAETAGREQEREARDQGVTVPPWDLGDASVVTAAAGLALLRQLARATANLLGGSLVQSAVRQVMRLIGAGRPAQEVAAEVDVHLRELSEAFPRENIAAAMTAAQNEGRMAVLAVTPPATYVASEALDRNSCVPCRAIDGTRFADLDAARRAYPAGGYNGCLGGSRCRGMLVTVWPQSGGQTTTGMILAASAHTMPQQTTEQGGTMPYSVVQHHADCAADTPWAVVKDDTQDLMGCHTTQAEAEEQQRALYAEDGEAPPGAMADSAAETPTVTPAQTLAVEEQTAAWEGVLAVEGVTTGDGREFAEGALSWADLPVPLRWNKEDSHGGEPHTVAVNVGRIDRIWRDGGKIMGAGVLNLAEPDGQRAHDLIKGEYLRGVSIDADSIAEADIELVWPDDANEGMEEDGDLFEMLFAQPEKMIFHGGRIRAATLVDIPAFAEAFIALLDEAGAVVAGGQPLTDEERKALRGGPETAQPQAVAKPAVTAAGGDWRPPAAWFADPELSVPTGITITDDGRLYGHAAQWGSCHIGQDDTCIQPPREDAHPYYMTGEVACDDGSRVAVGQVTVGTGHAPLHLGASPAAEHYDNTGAAVADVAVGNDRHGIWVAGAVRPGVDPLKVYELQAAGQVSGDWRRIGGALRLVGLLAVNVPGFPVPKMRARVASGQPQALLAAGRPTVAWGLSEEESERQAVRLVMRMLSRRVHPGGR